ncbi:DUF4062 domain-containing protein [Bradyrhizobium sp. OK095]|uniref:DUF4062 domain-containing protein n=1 Tax=Bradyrhizobium sp. OK095 TaxID=1882760 RepID=UPI0008D40ED7|nr:DUF4062 domain-containing protein [Bradyrhizobium sp. OK095]SEN25134.1 protein of unknown function [Bradyrhizobium sp. OK095]
MDKVYQVFISSTFADLKKERQQVSNTLAKAGYLAAGMELFPASDEQQLEYIQRVIDRSDYYVVIVAGRYGSTAGDGKSFTEKEFEYAHSKGIPILAFLHSNPRGLAVEKTDEDPAKAARLQEFRERLQTGRLVEFWSASSDLSTNVLIAVANSANLKPRVGWIRGDQAVDPKVLQDMQRLRIENAELRASLAEFLGEPVGFDPTLVGPNDTMPLSVLVSGQQSPTKLEVAIGDLFIAVYDQLLAELPEGQMRHHLGHAAAKLANIWTANQSYMIEPESVVALRQQLEALGLLMPISGRSGTGATFISWTTTDKGRKFAALKNARRKGEPNG